MTDILGLVEIPSQRTIMVSQLRTIRGRGPTLKCWRAITRASAHSLTPGKEEGLKEITRDSREPITRLRTTTSIGMVQAALTMFQSIIGSRETGKWGQLPPGWIH